MEGNIFVGIKSAYTRAATGKKQEEKSESVGDESVKDESRSTKKQETASKGPSRVSVMPPAYPSPPPPPSQNA